jgi:hypothetical protein
MTIVAFVRPTVAGRAPKVVLQRGKAGQGKLLGGD